MEGKLIKTDTGNYVIETDKGILSSTFDSSKFEYKLSLTNCQAIERGYDLDELADKHINKYYELDDSAKRVSSRLSFKAGFQKALEILGDKKFSAGQLLNAMDLVWQWMNGEDYGCKTLTEVQDKHIQSLQQNVWAVTIETEITDVKLNYGATSFEDCHHVAVTRVVKLDNEGRLILKRKL